jgi:beta-phosphoglucomutase family hydrolase
VGSLTGQLGLPVSIQACLFDLDGVLTDTASTHARAWGVALSPYAPFDLKEDYDAYVDGRPRLDGARNFLTAKGLHPDDETLWQVAKRKDDVFEELLRQGGVRAYKGSLKYVEAVRERGLRLAVVSSSHHCQEVLTAARFPAVFEVRVDGHVADELHLRGKPNPDPYLTAARKLGVPPSGCAVFEDALAGVEAGYRGGFGYVVGVDRAGQAEALKKHGASVVVEDLGQLLGAPG